MPELDGLDATRRICERWPPESRPHIIAMTANALPEDREACFAAGMNDYVAKPIRAEELAAALKRAQPLRERRRRCGRESEIGLDAAALQNLRDLGGDEFLAEVVDVFLADAPALITSLRSSLERAGHRGAPACGAHAEVERLDAGRDGVRGALPRRSSSGPRTAASTASRELVDRIEQEYRTLEERSRAPLRSEPVS